MDNPRKARVVEQHFLNLPGFHAGAYVRAYVEDTTDQELRLPEGKRGGWAPVPPSCSRSPNCIRRIEFEFDMSDADDRWSISRSRRRRRAASATLPPTDRLERGDQRVDLVERVEARTRPAMSRRTAGSTHGRRHHGGAERDASLCLA